MEGRETESITHVRVDLLTDQGFHFTVRCGRSTQKVRKVREALMSLEMAV